MSTNVYLIEDHPALRAAFYKFLKHVDGLHVCGVAETAQEALAHLDQCEADIAFVNVSLPDMSGLDLVRELRRRQPHIACIMISSAEQRFYAQQALAAGARGYLVKGSPAEVEEAIQSVLAGKTYLSKQLRGELHL